MTETLDAVFDGKVFLPEHPISLEPNTHVRMTIESDKPEAKSDISFLQTARSLKLQGPADWSARFEEYLYRGDKKTNE